MATNFTTLRTCAATGGNVAVALKGEVGAADPREYLGPNSTWDQRRAFEWAYLATCFRLAGDAAQAAYCQGRVDQYTAKEA